MYFGLTNSPATFQTMMNKIFQDLITEGVISVYLDDILIFTDSLEEHHRITCLVLDSMCEHKLYLWPEKCKFEKTKIKYLSVIISHNKVEMDPVKIAGVADWLTPSNKKEVQSFVSFVNFYQCFIPGFSHHARGVIYRDIHPFPYFPYPHPLYPCSYVFPLTTSVLVPRTTPQADDL
jgi:hypothetical protein